MQQCLASLPKQLSARASSEINGKYTSATVFLKIFCSVQWKTLGRQEVLESYYCGVRKMCTYNYRILLEERVTLNVATFLSRNSFIVYVVRAKTPLPKRSPSRTPDDHRDIHPNFSQVTAGQMNVAPRTNTRHSTVFPAFHVRSSHVWLKGENSCGTIEACPNHHSK